MIPNILWDSSAWYGLHGSGTWRGDIAVSSRQIYCSCSLIVRKAFLAAACSEAFLERP